MSPHVLEDPILRENHRYEIARRLILHGVRTWLVGRLTGLTRSRLSTVRRRLMIGAESRPRGRPRNPLHVFLSTPEARRQGAALAVIFALLDVPLEERLSSGLGSGALGLAERLCEAYEAHRACCPGTELELEELIMLRSLLAKGGAGELTRCPRCKCMILMDRFDAHRECSHCNPEPLAREQANESLIQHQDRNEAERDREHREGRKVRHRDRPEEKSREHPQ